MSFVHKSLAFIGLCSWIANGGLWHSFLTRPPGFFDCWAQRYFGGIAVITRPPLF